jgi:hypothetical protein
VQADEEGLPLLNMAADSAATCVCLCSS